MSILTMRWPFGLAALTVCALSAAGASIVSAQTPAAGAQGTETADVDPLRAMNEITGALDRDRDFVLAEVEGQTITKGDLADVIRTMPPGMASLGYKTLFTRGIDQLLRQRMIGVSARKDGLDKDPVVSRRASNAAERSVAEAWLDRRAESAVTEDALKARYERDVAGKPGQVEVRPRVILLPTEAEARLVLGLIQTGGDFAVLAKQRSKDISAENGGDLGYVRLDALSPEVGSVAFALSPGQTAAYPVLAGPGYFLVRVEGRRQRGTPPFEEARPRLVQESRREAVANLLRTLVSDIKLTPAAESAGVTGTRR